MKQPAKIEETKEPVSDLSAGLDGRIFNREWCARMAQLEDDSEIGAGLLSVDPIFDDAV